MAESIEIPRPHVPYGPEGVPEMLADADYLDEAARHIKGGYAVGGSNLTATVIRLLHDSATALRLQHEHSQHWWACAVNAPRPDWRGPCDCEVSRKATDSGKES